MSGEELTIGISVLTVVSGAINVYVGLRLAALQAQMKADSAAAEIALVRQFIAWKDEILQLLNSKYVTAVLIPACEPWSRGQPGSQLPSSVPLPKNLCF